MHTRSCIQGSGRDFIGVPQAVVRLTRRFTLNMPVLLHNLMVVVSPIVLLRHRNRHIGGGASCKARLANLGIYLGELVTR